MTDLPPVLADGPAIAADLGIHPGTIRNWARAGHITRHGHDHRGRTLYDYDEVKGRASRRDTGTAAPLERAMRRL